MAPFLPFVKTPEQLEEPSHKEKRAGELFWKENYFAEGHSSVLLVFERPHSCVDFV